MLHANIRLKTFLFLILHLNQHSNHRVTVNHHNCNKKVAYALNFLNNKSSFLRMCLCIFKTKVHFPVAWLQQYMYICKVNYAQLQTIKNRIYDTLCKKYIVPLTIKTFFLQVF